MRYTGTHKDETRKKLLRAASTALREKGPERLGVAEVMAAAGLTHGGFYAHFKSKDELLVAAVDEAFAHGRKRAMRVVEGLPPRHALAHYIDYYVSATHRDHPENGCPVTALNADTPRQSKKFRAAFDAGVKSLSGFLANGMVDAGVADAEKLAPSILAAMAGAVVLSRTITDRDLSDDLLVTARDGIKTRLGLTETVLAGEDRAMSDVLEKPPAGLEGNPRPGARRNRLSRHRPSARHKAHPCGGRLCCLRRRAHDGRL